MRVIDSQRTGAWCVLALLSLILSSCGGGGTVSSSGGSSSQQPSEILYAQLGNLQIQAFQIDSSSGELNSIQIVDPPPGDNCVSGAPIPPLGFAGTLLATSPAKFLFAANTACSASNGAVTSASLDSYSIGTDGTLTAVAGSPFAVPAEPDGLQRGIQVAAINPANSILYAQIGDAAYLEGFQIDSQNGALTPTANFTSLMQFDGAAPFTIDPSGQFLYVTVQYLLADAGLPAGIAEYAITPATGALTPVTTFPDLPSSSQPEGVVMDSTGHFVYINLFDAGSPYEIAGFVRNPGTGELTEMPGSPFASEATPNPAVIQLIMHPSGKFLYALNLNGGTVSAFAIDSSTGDLSPVAGSPFPTQLFSVDGLPPVQVMQGPMAVDPSGNFLYVGCDEPMVAIYRIDQSTGALQAGSGSPENLSSQLYSYAIVQAP